MKTALSDKANAAGPPAARGLFWREWLRAPLRVGAIAPSGAGLAEAMTRGLDAASGPVVELGPGTGVFTAALLGRGIAPGQIAAIEANESFAAALALRLPEVTVIHGDALRTGQLAPYRNGETGLVLCGLPLLSMTPARVLRLLRGCFAVLGPEGEMRAFTYGLRCPIPQAVLDRAGLVAQRMAFVPVNLPPAFVYVVRRAPVAG